MAPLSSDHKSLLALSDVAGNDFTDRSINTSLLEDFILRAVLDSYGKYERKVMLATE